MSVQQLFEQFLGGQKQDAQDQGAKEPTSIAGKAGSLLQAIPGGLTGGLAAGGLLGLVAGNKKVRKAAGNLASGAATIGGGAALGALAYTAYQRWQGSNAPAARGSMATGLEPSAFDPDHATGTDGQVFQVSLVKAMIAAANADGDIDSQEQATIYEKVEEMQLDAKDKALVFDTLQKPPDAAQIASFAGNLAQGCEIYLVSRIAIDLDDLREQAYLQDLADRLSLPDDLKAELDNQFTQAQPIAA